MVWKYSGLGALLVMAGVIVSPVAAGATGSCGELLEKVCIGCHQSDRFCTRLGVPEKEWRGLLKLMIANGAELDKEDVGPLAICLSEASAEAKKVCGK